MNCHCCCLIPFYNEGKRIINVLEKINKANCFKQIICINDGSTDSGPGLIKKNYPKIKLINLSQNLGKSDAIKIGLKNINCKYIFLIDADLQNLNTNTIKKAVQKIQNNNIDMIILKRKKAILPSRILRFNILWSGERVLKTKYLIKSLKHRPKNFQIEFAINKYLQDNNKKVYWVPSCAVNTYPTQKFGIIKGSLRFAGQTISYLRYGGFLGCLKQTLFFARKKIN